MIRGNDSPQLDEIVVTLRKLFGLSSRSTNLAVVSAAYDKMAISYRSEYFYKNLIAKKLFRGAHKCVNATLLNEFRIGQAIADCVLVNGKGNVYEIKTEFDSPDKLKHQVDSYYKAFPFVNVVTHENSIERYQNVLAGSTVGLLVFRNNGSLSRIKDAEMVDTQFDVRTILNALRQAEVLDILRDWHGSVPKVPNGVLYDVCLELAHKMPVGEFQSAMQQALKRRTLRKHGSWFRNPTLEPLLSVVVQLDPTDSQSESLMHWLEARVG